MKVNYSKVSIIILNWNGLRDTIECLESVKKINYPNYEILVVDNGSSDGSCEKIEEQFSNIILIKNNVNLGFADGNNIGIKYAIDHGSEYILLLNNDTVADPDLIKSFMTAAHSYNDAGIFAGKIYDYADRGKILFAGAQRDRGDWRLIQIGNAQYDHGDKYNKVIETDYACGCSLFFKKEVCSVIGMLDGKYFLNFEETDWCYRAKRAGFRILFIPDAKVWHKVSRSFGGSSTPIYSYYFMRNLLLWAKKNLSMSERIRVYVNSLKIFFPCLFYIKGVPIIKRLYWDIKDMIKHNGRQQFIAKIIGIRDFLFGRFGNCPAVIEELGKQCQRSAS